MKRISRLFFAVMLMVALSFQQAAAQKYNDGLIDKTIAIVGGEAIFLSQLEGEIQVMRAQGITSDKNLRCTVLENLLVQKLFLNQARLDSLTVREDHVEYSLEDRINNILMQLGGEKETEEYFKKPVFLTDYPKDIKAFYMKLNPDGKTVRAMDLLAPGIGEIIGGSQREDSLEILENRITELGMKPEDYEFYLDLRRFGSFPHSGYGLGFERIIMYITGMTNIRDVIPFPRTPNNAEF